MNKSKRVRIYTKVGDKGNTSLFNGDKVLKNDARVNAFGAVDELNCMLGLIATELERILHIKQTETAEVKVIHTRGLVLLLDIVLHLQNELFVLGSDLATPMSDLSNDKVNRITDIYIRRLERWIDDLDKELPVLRAFILPGGSELSARLHLSRTVARRAEREIVTAFSIFNLEQPSINEQTLKYINRLSDLLFVMSRAANQFQNVSDVLWEQTNK